MRLISNRCHFLVILTFAFVLVNAGFAAGAEGRNAFLFGNAAHENHTKPVNTANGETQSGSSETSFGGVKEITIDLGGGVKLEMEKIPAGTFKMGSPSGETDRRPNEGPLHAVTISKDFYMGKYEVTQGQWTKVMGSNPSEFKNGDNCPVETVSWDDICKSGGFLEKINILTGKTFRLPTEAEWEYACRAGTETRFYFGEDPAPEFKSISGYVWYNGNSRGTPHPAGQKLPNAFGLYDMHGNVFEWCSDFYGNYDARAVSDPSGPAIGSGRVARGSSWGNYAYNCRSAYRYGYYQSYSYCLLGFRIVLPAGRQ